MMTDKDYNDLVSNYRQFDSKSPTISSLGEFLDEKKTLSELKQEHDNAGRFGKKKAQKAVDEQQNKLDKIEERLIKQLNDAYSILSNEMNENLQTIAILAPDNVSSIRGLHPPLTFNPKEIIQFCKETKNVYSELLMKLKNETVSTLIENKELLERYQKYVEIQPSSVESTSKTTKEAIELLNLDNLLKQKEKLKNERTILEKSRNDVERGLRNDLLQELTTLEKDNQTATSLGIQLEVNISENFQKIRSDFETSKSLDQLFSAESLFKQTKADFLNGLRSEITKVRSTTDSQINA